MGSCVEESPRFGDPQEQHEWLTLGEGAETEARVERLCATVEGLDDDRTRADELGCGQGALRGIDQQIGPEPTSLATGVAASCPSRITGTGSGMLLPTRDGKCLLSTALAARL